MPFGGTSPTSTPITSTSTTSTGTGRASSVFVEASAEVSTFQEWQDLVRERFPGWAWALSHPELGSLLQDAAEQEFTPGTFEAQLRSTQWWTSRTEAQRAWDVFLKTGGEAEIEDRITNQVGILGDLAGQLGAEISEDGLRALATSVLRNNLSEDEITGALIEQASDFAFGSFTAAEAEVRRLADQYLISPGSESVNSFATKLLKGEMNTDGVIELFKAQASERFPALEPHISRGVNLQEYFSPHRSIMAQMLGISPASIDMASDPRFMPVLQFGAGNEIRPMTVAETSRYVRTIDDFWSTPGGQGETEMFGFLGQLSRTMGVRR